MVTAVIQAGVLNVYKTTHQRKDLYIYIPKPLVCSQLPADVEFPISITVKVVEQQAAGAAADALGAPLLKLTYTLHMHSAGTGAMPDISIAQQPQRRTTSESYAMSCGCLSRSVLIQHVLPAASVPRSPTHLDLSVCTSPLSAETGMPCTGAICVSMLQGAVTAMWGSGITRSCTSTHALAQPPQCTGSRSCPALLSPYKG
jgi:hypothetical protein